MSNKLKSQQNGSADQTSSARKNASGTPKTQARKRVNVNQVKVMRKVNMVKFDSSTQVLSLFRKVFLSDGTTPVELNGKLDLTALSEQERQRIISVAKLITNWCSGHDIDLSQSVKRDGEEVELPSPLVKVNSLIARAMEDEPASDSATPEEV
nr:MAG: hypothetical protein [Mitoviridae sp.]